MVYSSGPSRSRTPDRTETGSEWIHFCPGVDIGTRRAVLSSLSACGLDLNLSGVQSAGYGIIVCNRIDKDGIAAVQDASQNARVLVLVVGPGDKQPRNL